MRTSLRNFMQGILRRDRRRSRRRNDQPIAGLESLENRALLAGMMAGHFRGEMTLEAAVDANVQQVDVNAVEQLVDGEETEVDRTHHRHHRARGHVRPADHRVVEAPVDEENSVDGETGDESVEDVPVDDTPVDVAVDEDPVDDVTVDETDNVVEESSNEAVAEGAAVVEASVASDDAFLQSEMLDDLLSLEVDSETETLNADDEVIADDVVVEEVVSDIVEDAVEDTTEDSPVSPSESDVVDPTVVDAVLTPGRRLRRLQQRVARPDERRGQHERRRHRDRFDKESPVVEVRSVDGTGNNIENPELGSTDEQLLRVAEADYADGISTPAGEDRPSAREISNALSAQDEETATNDRDLSAFL